MRVLLDSHVLLWALNDPGRIRGSARAVVADASTKILVSVATIWELAIKQGLGQLRADGLPEQLLAIGHELLPVTVEHAWHVRTLPRHHRDPFDRLLVAQAQIEDLPLITHDRQLERYDIRIIRA